LFTSPLNRLRQSTWLEAIPDTLTVPEIGGRPGRSLSIERATHDARVLVLQHTDELIEQNRGAVGRCSEACRRSPAPTGGRACRASRTW
jgi:hypothetical protein